MSSFFRPGNDGIADVPGLNVSSVLYIRGRKFEDYISELVFEDQFEQSEINELKLLVQYLNTSGLSSEWIVDNQNKNQDLKTAITALQTKLAQIDTTALSQTSVLNNDNRNSVLKTRIDGNDASISALTGRVDGNDSSIVTLNGKTRYISSTQGTNNPNTFSDFSVDVGDRILNKVLLQTANGANQIAMLTNTSTLQGQNDFDNNRILLNAPLGRIELDCKNLQLQGSLIEMGADFNIGGESEIRLGTKRANIKIGSHQSPDLNEPTIITIGKRSVTQNTHTNLEGNVYTGEARFESLSKSQALSLSALFGIITSSGLPLYVNIISALGLSSYVHSDLWGLAGSVIKNGDLATTNDIKVKSYSLYNTDANFAALFPIENTFIASGSSSKTLLLGSIKEQVFSNLGDITLRHNNILATNINWALSEANDNVNALCIKGNDGILLHQGASSVGASMKILNSRSGKIELLIGNQGTQASCLTGMTVDWNSGQPQVICGTKGGLQNIQQTKSKLLVQQSDTAGDVGIEVVKNGISPANAPLNRTTISDNNIDTHSITLKTNFTGTTTRALYLDGTDNLRFGPNLVTPVKDIVAGSYISVTNNNGTYTIARSSDNILANSLTLSTNYTGGQQRTLYLDAQDNLRYNGSLVTPVRDVVGSTHISVTNNNGSYTIARSTDNVVVNTLQIAQTNYTGANTKTLYLDAGDNLRFAGNLVTPVKDIVAGAHISVTNNNGVYTIARTGGGGSVVDVGEDLVISATAVQLPRKSSWYGQTFVRFVPISRQFYDVYMSANGKYIFWANRATNGTAATILSATNYANDGFFTESNVSKLWITICGTTEGNRVFACGSNEIWANTPPSTTWTQSTTPPNFGGAIPVQFKCNGDGRYQLITDGRSNSFGAIYKSNDTGATWTQQNITGLNTLALGCCVNASGKTQYVVCDGTNGNINAENGAGGLYRSQDYGQTWVRVIAAPNGNHQRVACDATGRYIGLVGSGLLYTSKDYGATWISHSISSTRSVWVSQGGDYMWVGILSASNNFFFSTDHGHTFAQGNTTPDGSYQGMANDCIACNNDGSIVVAGSISGLRINFCREFPNETRMLTAGTGISVTNLGNGSYTIANTIPAPVTINVCDIAYTSYAGHAGFGNNSFSFEHNWDFENYEYDITVDVQTITAFNTHMNWTWDGLINNIQYRQNWNDHDGTSFFSTGGNSSQNIIYLYADAHIHHHFKGRLRQPRVPIATYHPRLLLEHSCVQTPVFENSNSYSNNFRFSRGYNQRLAPNNTSGVFSFNGNRTLTFWMGATNYFTNNRAHLRIFRVPIR
jgi:photosystem II stability/assembly factor-like uncharacterized protein